MSFRFRDVYDHLVRIADEALIFQDRITGILDAHLSNVSNRLNEVMKVLTVVSTIFMPLTLLTGPVRHERAAAAASRAATRAQFWWLIGIMVVVVVGDARGVPPQALDLSRGQDHTACPPTSPTRSPPARSSSARPRSSRSWSRTPSTPARAALTIHVELGGKKQVRVEDDGEGMEPDDARLAHRAARDEQDPAGRRSRGHPHARLPRRGAAVDRVGVALRAADARARAAERHRDPRQRRRRRVGRRGRRAARARVVEVNDLFYNLPARRKFLKSDGAESAQVSRIVTQLALAYPEVGFTLTSAGRTVLQCPPAASLRDRLYQLYGERDDLIEVAQGGRRHAR